ncbi:MAG: B12-binding domain-containing radical SAM protein [Planctomycetota bacterium]
MSDVFLIQLPSPAGKTVFREWAGGMGTSQPSSRAYAGHDPEYYEIPYFPFLWIARGLELRNIASRYFDLQSQQRFDWPELERTLRLEQPKVLVTAVNIPSLTHDLELLARIKQALPSLRTVVIGPTAKVFPERVLREGRADLVLDGQEELLVPEIVARLLANELETAREGCWYLDGEAVQKVPAKQKMKDLNFIDFPAYHLLDFDRYQSDFFFGKKYRYMTVYTSKGCAYECVYCPYPFGFGERFIYRSPDRVVADIERLVKQHGVEQICFRDQVFTVNKKHTTAICQGLIEKKLDVKWVCETRYDVVSEELLTLMQKAGCCEVHYGLESADPEIFAAVGKPGGPVSLDRFEETIALTKRLGLRCHLHLILGLPGESWDSVHRTVAFLKRTRPDSVQTAILSPYPGTPLHETLKAEGKLASTDWERYGGFEAVQPTEHMSVQDLEEAKRFVAWNWDKSAWDKIKLRAKRYLLGTR